MGRPCSCKKTCTRAGIMTVKASSPRATKRIRQETKRGAAATYHTACPRLVFVDTNTIVFCVFHTQKLPYASYRSTTVRNPRNISYNGSNSCVVTSNRFNGGDYIKNNI